MAAKNQCTTGSQYDQHRSSSLIKMNIQIKVVSEDHLNWNS